RKVEPDTGTLEQLQHILQADVARHLARKRLRWNISLVNQLDIIPAAHLRQHFGKRCTFEMEIPFFPSNERLHIDFVYHKALVLQDTLLTRQQYHSLILSHLRRGYLHTA